MTHRQVLHFAATREEVRDRLRETLSRPLSGLIARFGFATTTTLTGLVVGWRVWVRPVAPASPRRSAELFEPKLRGRLRRTPGGGCDFQYRIFPGTQLPHPAVVGAVGLAFFVAAAIFGAVVHSPVLGLIAAAPGIFIAIFLLNWILAGKRAAAETTALLDAWLQDLRSKATDPAT